MNQQKLISILCAQHNSNYFNIEGLDIWTQERNAYNYTGNNPIIAHPPCAQWSRLHKFAKENKNEKELALHCWDLVNKNGGILEHPSGSHLFKYVGADTKKILLVNQYWWGFPARKKTLLYFHNVEPLSHPIRFEFGRKSINDIRYDKRSLMTLDFCQWLVNCVQVSNSFAG